MKNQKGEYMPSKKNLLLICLFVSFYCYSQDMRNNQNGSVNNNEISYAKKTSSGVTTIRHINASSSDEYRTLRQSSIVDSLINESVKKLNLLSNIGNSSFSIDNFDKIITFDNEVFFVRVQHITLVDVNFIYPLNSVVESVEREKVSQIIYANGNIDLFIPFDEAHKDSLNYVDDRLIVRHRKAWESVQVTEDKSDLAGLIEVGPVNAVYDSDRMRVDNDFLEKNGLIILKRRAANLDADYVFVIKKTFNKGYGSFPSVSIEGIAYKYRENL